MVTFKTIDVMKEHGERFYITLRNVKVMTTEQYFPGGYRKEFIKAEDIKKAVLKLLPSITNRTDVVLYPSPVNYEIH